MLILTAYLAYRLQPTFQGSQGRTVGAGAGAEALEKCCLLGGPHGLLTQNYLTRHHPQWVGASPINHQTRKCPPGLPMGQSDRGIPQLMLPLPG